MSQPDRWEIGVIITQLLTSACRELLPHPGEAQGEWHGGLDTLWASPEVAGGRSPSSLRAGMCQIPLVEMRACPRGRNTPSLPDSPIQHRLRSFFMFMYFIALNSLASFSHSRVTSCPPSSSVSQGQGLLWAPSALHMSPWLRHRIRPCHHPLLSHLPFLPLPLFFSRFSEKPRSFLAPLLWDLTRTEQRGHRERWGGVPVEWSRHDLLTLKGEWMSDFSSTCAGGLEFWFRTAPSFFLGREP